MQSFSLMLIPVVLLAGLAYGVFHLGKFLPHPTPCPLGACPLELSSSDSGSTFTYGVTTRFDIYLNENDDPKAHLSCTPSGVIGPVSNVPPVEPPYYAARFEGVAPGTCTLSDDHFSATIVIQEEQD